jgi:hypothetical protein
MESSSVEWNLLLELLFDERATKTFCENGVPLYLEITVGVNKRM